jgi:hypothetical protein
LRREKPRQQSSLLNPLLFVRELNSIRSAQFTALLSRDERARPQEVYAAVTVSRLKLLRGLVLVLIQRWQCSSGMFEASIF